MQCDAVRGQTWLVLVEHERGDLLKVFLAQRLERNDLVHTADELGAQELLQRFMLRSALATSAFLPKPVAPLWSVEPALESCR